MEKVLNVISKGLSGVYKEVVGMILSFNSRFRKGPI